MHAGTCSHACFGVYDFEPEIESKVEHRKVIVPRHQENMEKLKKIKQIQVKTIALVFIKTLVWALVSPKKLRVRRKKK